jgi:serine/threonine protein phosphatase PrpC
MSATVATHPGRVRSENQDTALVPGFCSTGLSGSPVTFRDGAAGAAALYAVIDGMGGHSGGRRASQSAAFYLADCAAGAAEELDVTAMLDGANRLLYEQMQRDQGLLGMGATIAGVAFGPRQATVFNVGDARVYSCGATRLTSVSPHIVPLEPLRPGDRLLICSDGVNEVASFDEIGAALSAPDPAMAASRLLGTVLDGGAPDNVTFIVLEELAA